eukprot:12307836-Alexandrium_andersonii.AAC.1
MSRLCAGQDRNTRTRASGAQHTLFAWDKAWGARFHGHCFGRDLDVAPARGSPNQDHRVVLGI